MIELNTIYNEDCLETMKRMPDNFVDLIVTDPPYGLGIDGQKKSKSTNPKHNRKEHKFLGWDGSIPPAEIFREMERVSKNQVIWGGNYFVEHLTKGRKGWIVWDKGQHGLTMSDAELAYSSFNKPTRVIVANRAQILKDGSVHPTQKPLILIKKVLGLYANTGDLIYDPFMGSGTTAKACRDMGLEYIGSEISKEYCEIAESRLKQEAML